MSEVSLVWGIMFEVLVDKDSERYLVIVEFSKLLISLSPFAKFHSCKKPQRKKKAESLTLDVRLNVQVDELVTSNLSPPMHTHILNAPIAIYIDNKYIHNKYVAAIISHCSLYNAK